MNLKGLVVLVVRFILASVIFYFLAIKAIDLNNQKAVLITAIFWILSIVICSFVPIIKKAAPKK